MNSITFNGVKATIIFHDNNWELTLQTGKNEASICGSILSEPSTPYPSPVLEPLNPGNVDKKYTECIIAIGEPLQDDLIHTALIKKIATDIGFKEAIENPEEHLKNFNAYCWNNELLFDTVEQMEQGILHYFRINSTEYITYNPKIMKEFEKWKNDCTTNDNQTMEAFIQAKSDSFERVKLMKHIFLNMNLIFKDEYMDLYYKWNAPKVNRYKKMCLFIEAHKNQIK